METVICGHKVLRDVYQLALTRSPARWGWLARVHTYTHLPGDTHTREILVRAYVWAQTHVGPRFGVRTHGESSIQAPRNRW